MRCDVHDLAAGPDGQCALCRRAARASEAPAATRRVFAYLGVVAVLVVGGGAIYRFGIGRSPSAPPLVAEPPTRAAVASTGAPAAPPATITFPPTSGPDAVAWNQALASVKVVVYTTSWCPTCKKAKAWLRASAIPFEERDIESSAEYASQMHAISRRSAIPTFDIEGAVDVGFDSAWVLTARDDAARRKMPPR